MKNRSKQAAVTLWMVTSIFITFACDAFQNQSPQDTNWGSDPPIGKIYVDITNDGSADGASWETAYPTIQEGIIRASELVQDGTVQVYEVWVAKGVYHIYESSVHDTIDLAQDIAVFGGFAGDEPYNQRDSRDPELNETILDGRSVSDDDDRVLHVVTAQNITNTIIDGFTIQFGNNADSNAVYPDNGGAGMVVLDSSPTIKNCKFRNNEAHRGGGISIHGDYGPDGENEDVLSPSISNTTFSNNSASLDGGGVLAFSTGAIFDGCTFDNNVGGIMGGGLASRNSNVKVKDCVFRANDAHRGGGLFTRNYPSNKTPKISNTIFHLNTAARGAGLYSEGNNNFGAAPIVRNSTFAYNTASSSGGAVQTNTKSLQIENSILWGNEPQEIDGDGSESIVFSCIVEGGWQGAWDQNPRFLNPPEDLRIDHDSFAIDMGNEKTSTLEDAMGNRRWNVPGVGNAASSIDLGAYEYSQGIVTGRVTDGFTGQPLQDVQLTIQPSTHSEPILPPLTNANGDWKVDGNESVDKMIWQRHGGRSVKIVASRNSYHDQTVYKTIRLENGAETINLVMFSDDVDTTDTDDDGLWDSVEGLFGTSIGKQDSDDDGLPDGWEVWGHHWVDYTAFGYSPVETNDWLGNDELNPSAAEGRYEIIPVFFMPSDLPENSVPPENGKNLFLAYLRLAQERYRHFLGTDTFRISQANVLWHHANNANWYYCRQLRSDVVQYPYDDEPGQAHLEVGELMEHFGENFDTTNKIFVIVYVNPLEASENPPENSIYYDLWTKYSGGDCVLSGNPRGGGRPMWRITELASGGVMQMSYRSLTDGIGTLSTITHELGHAFGLVHVDVRGSFYMAGDNDGHDLFDQTIGSPSIMAYNGFHKSYLFHPQVLPTPSNDVVNDWFQYRYKANDYYKINDRGMLLPEELYVLDKYVDYAFPQFDCDEFHDICSTKERWYQGDPDADHLGKMPFDGESTENMWNNKFHRNRLIPMEADGFGKHGFGYELYRNETRELHKPFIPFEEAKSNCDWHKSLNPGETVECYFNGIEFV